jgi:hypothetical protein
LAGVLASTGINLLTGIVLMNEFTAQLRAIVISVGFFLASSAGASLLAWYLDEMHRRWVDQGKPFDQEHIKRIVKEYSVRATTALSITLATAVLGVLQLCFAL